MTTRAELRHQAREAGERFFEDLRGCKRGHQVFYTKSGCCVQCANAARPMSFATWANRKGLTGDARLVAKAAWDASREHMPTTTDRLLACLRGSRDTAPMIAAETGLSREHVARLLHDMEHEGLVTRETRGRVNVWRLV